MPYSAGQLGHLAVHDRLDLLGTLGFAGQATSQTAIGTTITDITGLAVTVTVAAGRRVRVSAVGQINHDNTQVASLILREGTTVLQTSQHSGAAGETRAHSPSVILTPTAGSHTYKVSMQTSTGTAGLVASATQPAYILVEDIGAV